MISTSTPGPKSVPGSKPAPAHSAASEGPALLQALWSFSARRSPVFPEGDSVPLALRAPPGGTGYGLGSRCTSLGLGLLLLGPLGCEDEVYSDPGVPVPVASEDPSAAPLRPAGASASARLSASASSSAAPISVALSSSLPSGPSKWEDFSGPNVKPDLKAQERGWMVVPLSARWETLKLSVETVGRVEDTFVVVRPHGADKAEVFVPGALSSPLKRADGLLKGDAVVIPAMGSRAVARVAAVSETEATVRFRYAGELKEIAVPLGETIKLDGSLKFGAVVVARDASRNVAGEEKIVWRGGQFISTGEGKSWMVTWGGRPFRFPSATIKPMSAHVVHKAGDKIMVVQGDNLLSGVVQSSEEDALRYAVRFEDGSETSVPFDAVTSPIH